VGGVKRVFPKMAFEEHVIYYQLLIS